MALVLILIAMAFSATSGMPGLFTKRRSPWGERISVAMVGIASLLGLVGASLAFRHEPLRLPKLSLPLVGWSDSIGLDALSAFFLIPIFSVGGLGSVYGLGYWRQAEYPSSGRKLRLLWGLVVAGMALLVVARNALLFLVGWEVMALSAFLLVSTEDELSEARRAGWIYLAATHVGTLFLFAMFGLLRLAVGSFDLWPVGVEQAGLGLLTAIFFLALIGFGLKAGIMPLHFWLPSAHANAPSHVSAIMSGVLIKMGIYGLLRVTGLLPDPPVAWGALLLILGAISGVLGVVYAIGQHDLKRLLAYHSIENIGIIVIGLGLAMIGRSLGRADLAVLGMAGCLLHTWNHCLFKALLFLSAGAVVHATHTRRIDQLGGLAGSMPWTASMFLIGAVAICGLPPLNGFVSELLIYLGLLRSMGVGGGPSWAGAATAVPVLAMIGGLAIACFVKAYGAVFLGESRGRATIGAREAPMRMILPMGVLAAGCALIGLFPFVVAPILDRAIGSWRGPAIAGEMQLGSLAPLASVSVFGLLLLSTIGIVSAWLLRRLRLPGVRRECTWGCAYAQPTARMQYTASSFAQMLVGLFGLILRPRTVRPCQAGIFPSKSGFESHVDDIVLDGQILPLARACERWLGRCRGLQQGLTQHYVLYILLAVVALLAWTMPMEQLIVGLFAR